MDIIKNKKYISEGKIYPLDPIIFFDKNNDRLLKAKNEAQASIGRFISKLLKCKKKSSFTFSIKTDFVQGRKHEHMWVNVKTYVKGNFSGKLNSNPALITNIKINEQVVINAKDIEDWLIMKQGKKEFDGGFSIKALYPENF